MMIAQTNSKMILQAAARLMIDGESMQYAAGLYSLPVRDFQDYLAGLFLDGATIIAEINTVQDSTLLIPTRIEPASIEYKSILPYYIVLTADKFHVIGNGMTVAETTGLHCFDDAYQHALLCIELDAKLLEQDLHE